MSTKFLFKDESIGNNEFGQYFSDSNYSATLAAATDTTLSVPGTAAFGSMPAYQFNKYVAVISVKPGAEVWVSLNNTASPPAGASFASTNSEMVTDVRAKRCKATDVLHFYTTASNVDVSVSFYSLPGQ